MQAFGRSLQVFGLILVPMALLYYFNNLGRRDESELMFGELMILAFGAGIFLLGRRLVKE